MRTKLKILILLLLLIPLLVTSQRGTFRHRGKVKLLKTDAGSGTDDVIVRDPISGELKIVAQNSLGGGGTTYTFGEGLTLSGSVVTLGGTLSAGSSTQITLGSDLPIESTFTIAGVNGDFTFGNNEVDIGSNDISLFANNTLDLGADGGIFMSTDAAPFTFDNGTGSTIGQVWTATGIGGQGYWSTPASTVTNLDGVLAQGGTITGNRFTTIGPTSLWQISAPGSVQLLLDADQDEIIFGNASNIEFSSKVGGTLLIGRNASTTRIGTTGSTVSIEAATTRINPSGITPITGQVLTAADATGRVEWANAPGGATAGIGITDNTGTFDLGGPINNLETVSFQLTGSGAFNIIDFLGAGLSMQNNNLTAEGGSNASFGAGEFNAFLYAGETLYIGASTAGEEYIKVSPIADGEIVIRSDNGIDPAPLKIRPQNDLNTGQVGQVMTKIANDGTVGWGLISAVTLTPVSKASITTPVVGMFIMDSDEANKLKFYDGTAWQEISFIAD